MVLDVLNHVQAYFWNSEYVLVIRIYSEFCFQYNLCSESSGNDTSKVRVTVNAVKPG
jgi:hypothetical protein